MPTAGARFGHQTFWEKLYFKLKKIAIFKQECRRANHKLMGETGQNQDHRFC